MNMIRTVRGIAAGVFAVGLMICQPADAGQKRGAKALFYDPGAAGTVQHSGSSGSGPGGAFNSRVSREGGDGASVNPISNYYDNLNPGVMYWIELIRPGGGITRVSNDRVFRTGDQIRIHISTNSDGYMHVMHRGSTGAAQILPVSGSPNGEVAIGADYVVPSNGGFLRFDSNPGQENLKLVFASVKSSNDVLSSMKRVVVREASSVPAQLVALANQYGNSPNRAVYTESGGKDLVMVGYNAPPPDTSGYRGLSRDMNSLGGNAGYPQQQQQAYPPAGYPQQQQQAYPPAGYPQQQQAYPPPANISQNVFNISGMPDFRVNEAVYDAPGTYTVNTSGGAVKEPVVVEIVLNHHP